jgi:hypothetical protein
VKVNQFCFRSILAIGISTTSLFTFTPVQRVNAAKASYKSVVAAKDDDLVKVACKLFWNLSSPKSSSSKDMASWAKRNKSPIEKALTQVAKAKAINKKWAPLELEMATFLGALTLGSDPKYSFVFTQNKIVVDSQVYLVSTCRSRK